MPVLVLADQLITDGFEDISVPENEDEMKEMGFRTYPRKVCQGPEFYPFTDELDIPPVVLGHNTGALCSDWTPTLEGYDIEEVDAHHKHAYRLIYKVRNHRDLFNHHYEKKFMDDARTCSGFLRKPVPRGEHCGYKGATTGSQVGHSFDQRVAFSGRAVYT